MNKNIQIIIGGAEINHGSISLITTRDYVDYFVIGEGEWFFQKLLTGQDLSQYEININDNRIIYQPECELIPSADIFEPFTGRMINTMSDGSMFLELSRGCPYKCSYCY